MVNELLLLSIKKVFFVPYFRKLKKKKSFFRFGPMIINFIFLFYFIVNYFIVTAKSSFPHTNLRKNSQIIDLNKIYSGT